MASFGDFVMVSIDVDLNENAEQLRRFADENRFGWRFAVAPREMVRALSDAYGSGFLVLPSAEPMFVVDPKGGDHLLPFGRKSADVLRRSISQYRGA